MAIPAFPTRAASIPDKSEARTRSACLMYSPGE
jgi:hypothetical protein